MMRTHIKTSQQPANLPRSEAAAALLCCMNLNSVTQMLVPKLLELSLSRQGQDQVAAHEQLSLPPAEASCMPASQKQCHNRLCVELQHSRA